MCEADREECRDLVSLSRERAGMEETGWSPTDVTSLQPQREAVGEQF